MCGRGGDSHRGTDATSQGKMQEVSGRQMVHEPKGVTGSCEQIREWLRTSNAIWAGGGEEFRKKKRNGPSWKKPESPAWEKKGGEVISIKALKTVPFMLERQFPFGPRRGG